MDHTDHAGQDSSFGQWIKQMRRSQDLTQDALAECVGCSKGLIQKYEAGTRRPSKQIAELLADCFNLTPDARQAFIRLARRGSENHVSPALQEALIEFIASGSAAARRANPARYGGGRSRRPIRPKLPVRLTSFIGRESEVERLRQLLLSEDPSTGSGQAVRLLTLTGPGGVGKTRLALEAASGLQASFANGVLFVGLEAVNDPELVLTEIARQLDIKQMGKQTTAEALLSFLRHKKALLLLDNFEQVVSAAPMLAELLQEAPNLKVLVTSRETLRLSGEHEVIVQPLSLPDQKAQSSEEELIEYEAIRLFVERSQTHAPDFVLNARNTPAVVTLCHRLDGLPLAIELAAAQIRMFSPQAMLSQIENRMAFLTEELRDTPLRQQTMRNAISWSYDLLDDDEKGLFQRMSVFPGGCSLEAVRGVCDDGSSINIGRGLRALLKKSLLRQEERIEGEPRFIMLETIREYATERLAESGAEAIVKQRHALFFLSYVERAEPELRGPHQAMWLERLATEHNNLQAALRWAIASREAEIGLRLACALWRFWLSRGHLSEGRQYVNAALELVENQASPVDPLTHAGALYVAARLALMQGEYDMARPLYERGLHIYEEAIDKRGMAGALNDLGNIARCYCDYSQAQDLHTRSLGLYEELGDDWGVATARFQLANVAEAAGHYGEANQLFRSSLASSRKIGDIRTVAMTLLCLGNIELEQGDPERARTRYEEGLALSEELGDKWTSAKLLVELGNVARAKRDFDVAGARYRQGLTIFEEMGAKRNIADSLSDLGTMAAAQDDYERAMALIGRSLQLRAEMDHKVGIAECFEVLASVYSKPGRTQPGKGVRLLAAASTLRDAANTPITPAGRNEHDERVYDLRAQLGEDEFEVEWALGRTLPSDEAVSYALE